MSEIVPNPVYLQATGHALKVGRIGKVNWFLVTPIIRSMAEAAAADLQVTMEGPDGRDAEVWIREVGDGRLEVNYRTEERGRYDLSITWQGTHIRGSPYTVTIR